MTDIYVKQHDVGGVVRATLYNADGTPLDLTGATVSFIVASKPRGGSQLLKNAATVASAVDGTVTYTWQAGDTDIAGTFFAEWEVVYGTGEIASIPTEDYNRVIIAPDLG